MPAALSAIRGLALIGVVLAVVAVPIGAVLRAISVPGDRGDNGLGDIIATTLGAVLLIGGGAALILGGGLAVLARRALAAHAEIAGSRRTLLIAGLAVAGAAVVISSVSAGTAAASASASLSFLVGLSALFTVPYVIVAAASRRGIDLVAAGVVALALLGFTIATLGVQLVLAAGPRS